MPLIIRLAISLGLLALVIAFADWRAIGAVLGDVDSRWVIYATVLGVVDRLVINRRWQVLLAARDIRIRFVSLLRIQLAANFLGSFLPSSVGVDALRIAALCRSGEAPAQVVASTLVDRATLIIATLLFGSAMVLALAGTTVPENVTRLVLLVTAGVLIVSTLLLLPKVRWWVRSILITRLPERWRLVLTRIAEASLAYRSDRRVILRVAGWTIVLFAIRILFAKAVVLSCGVDVSFAALLVVIPILWIVVMLPITVGGIGVQDLSYVALMSLLGVVPAVAVSMSLIEHVVTRVVSLPGALFIADVSNPRPQRDFT